MIEIDIITCLLIDVIVVTLIEINADSIADTNLAIDVTMED